MEIQKWYSENFEDNLKGRYITLEMILPILNTFKNRIEITFPGISENGKMISLVKIGSGEKVILAWSQMHGNESTTTKSLFDLLKFLNQTDFFQKEIEEFLSNNSLYILPILNPDGAQLYTRENYNGIDLNRDAQNLSQSESRCLRAVFDHLQPELCLNMHDQRSIYGLNNGKPATVSFLSPSADAGRSITNARRAAMIDIVRMNRFLQNFIPNQIGRYDDGFNANCVGDTFQMLGVPTILFEAGHYKGDYQREKSREFIFYALVSLFGFIKSKEYLDYEDYFKIPENQKNYRDIIIENAVLESQTESISIAIQYKERLNDGKVVFDPILDYIGDLTNYYADVEINGKDLRISSINDEKLTIGVKVSLIGDFLI